jgi:hypothetical protein
MRRLTYIDAHLTENGRKYAKTLAKFIDCIMSDGPADIQSRGKNFGSARSKNFTRKGLQILLSKWQILQAPVQQ